VEVKTIKVPGEELILAPVGDIQYGSPNCDVAKLKRHIDYGVKHDWTFLGMGDYLDHFSPSNRRALAETRAGIAHEDLIQLLDDAITGRVEDLAAILDAGEARWLGLVYGDHGWTLADGQPADALLARKLKTNILGFSSLLHIMVGDCPLPLRIFAQHKSGGPSINPTGKTLALQRTMAAYNADIYLQGHSHLKYGVPVPERELVRKGGKDYLASRTRILGVTGSFLESTIPNQRDAHGWPSGSYVEQAGLNPVETGGLVITCKPVQEVWGWRWDMFVSA
jgi:hypothetical protein